MVKPEGNPPTPVPGAIHEVLCAGRNQDHDLGHQQPIHGHLCPMRYTRQAQFIKSRSIAGACGTETDPKRTIPALHKREVAQRVRRVKEDSGDRMTKRYDVSLFCYC